VKQVQVISFLVQKPGKVATWAVTGEKEMKVWNPIDNKKFETFSYLPLMTDAQIAKQVQMVIAKGLSPCLEFASEETSFVSNDNTVRFTGTAAGYYDNRYWTMWKLPMFGCTDASQVLNEVNECKKAYPDCYVRLAAFDSVKQVQVMSFVVQKPGQTAASSSTSYWAMAGTTGEKDMKVWTPIDNQKFETFSYLPPLSDGDIAKQVDFIIRNGLSPCLEFSSKETSTVSNDNTVRFTGTAAGYYDNRYWTMWKLPLFGCTDASQVLHEVAECRKAYPSCYIRLAAFDSVKQVQVISFLVHQPGATTAASSSTSYW
jgi:ribulose-bisphosphate carboxylase small chain